MYLVLYVYKPNGEVKNEIDFIIIDKAYTIKALIIRNKVNMGSDYNNMKVTCGVKFDFKNKRIMS